MASEMMGTTNRRPVMEDNERFTRDIVGFLRCHAECTNEHAKGMPPVVSTRTRFVIATTDLQY